MPSAPCSQLSVRLCVLVLVWALLYVLQWFSLASRQQIRSEMICCAESLRARAPCRVLTTQYRVPDCDSEIHEFEWYSNATGTSSREDRSAVAQY